MGHLEPTGTKFDQFRLLDPPLTDLGHSHPFWAALHTTTRPPSDYNYTTPQVKLGCVFFHRVSTHHLTPLISAQVRTFLKWNFVKQQQNLYVMLWFGMAWHGMARNGMTSYARRCGVGGVVKKMVIRERLKAIFEKLIHSSASISRE